MTAGNKMNEREIESLGETLKEAARKGDAWMCAQLAGIAKRSMDDEKKWLAMMFDAMKEAAWRRESASFKAIAGTLDLAGDPIRRWAAFEASAYSGREELSRAVMAMAGPGAEWTLPADAGIFLLDRLLNVRRGDQDPDLVRMVAGFAPEAPGIEMLSLAAKEVLKGDGNHSAAAVMAEIAIERGADVDAMLGAGELSGMTALHHAAAGGSPELAGALLDAGADPARGSLGSGLVPLELAMTRLENLARPDDRARCMECIDLIEESIAERERGDLSADAVSPNSPAALPPAPGKRAGGGKV